MADYKKMYLQLFNEVTTIIEQLQLAQQRAEEMYLRDDEGEVGEDRREE